MRFNRRPLTARFPILLVAASAATLMGVRADAVPIDFIDRFDGDRGSSQWQSLAGAPIPDYLGSIDSFALTTDGLRHVSSLVSHMPPHATRGIWSVTTFDSIDVDVSAIFSPKSGIDGIFNLWLLGSRGPGYSIKGGIFGANYGTLRFADAFQGWGLPADPSGDGFIREASEVGGVQTTWSWDYGRWYSMEIHLREFSTTVSIREEDASTPTWSTTLPRGYAWLGNSFRIGLVQSMYIPEPGHLYETNASVDSVALVVVPEPGPYPAIALGITAALMLSRSRGSRRRGTRHWPAPIRSCGAEQRETRFHRT